MWFGCDVGKHLDRVVRGVRNCTLVVAVLGGACDDTVVVFVGVVVVVVGVVVLISTERRDGFSAVRL